MGLLSELIESTYAHPLEQCLAHSKCFKKLLEVIIHINIIYIIINMLCYNYYVATATTGGILTATASRPF